jgi:hypothetical protein
MSISISDAGRPAIEACLELHVPNNWYWHPYTFAITGLLNLIAHGNWTTVDGGVPQAPIRLRGMRCTPMTLTVNQ